MHIQNHLHLDNQIPDNILSLFTYLPCVLYRCINLLHQIQINVLGPCICSREFVRQLKERGVDDGHIILVNRYTAPSIGCLQCLKVYRVLKEHFIWGLCCWDECSSFMNLSHWLGLWILRQCFAIKSRAEFLYSGCNTDVDSECRAEPIHFAWLPWDCLQYLHDYTYLDYMMYLLIL